MLSSSASPMKRPSMPIPQSMQKLIAKLQCPKKNDRKSLRSLPLPLRLDHGGHSSSKKSKIDDKFPNTVEHQSNEVSSISANPLDRREENDKDADLSGVSSFVNNKEKTFTYPKIDSSDTCDDGSSVLDITANSFSSIESGGKPDCLNLPVKRSKSDLKSAIKMKNEGKDNIPKKWVTFNDILQDTKRGSFVDELYDDDNDEPVDNHQLQSECSSENNESGLANYEDHLQPKPDGDNIHQQVLNVIQQVRRINDMITKANEEINSLFMDGDFGDAQ